MENETIIISLSYFYAFMTIENFKDFFLFLHYLLLMLFVDGSVYMIFSRQTFKLPKLYQLING